MKKLIYILITLFLVSGVYADQSRDVIRMQLEEFEYSCNFLAEEFESIDYHEFRSTLVGKLDYTKLEGIFLCVCTIIEEVESLINKLSEYDEYYIRYLVSPNKDESTKPYKIYKYEESEIAEYLGMLMSYYDELKSEYDKIISNHKEQ